MKGMFLVPDSVLMKSSSLCFDIVTPTDTHTSCFTKGYTRYIKGTGSILLFKDKATPPPTRESKLNANVCEEEEIEEEDNKGIEKKEESLSFNNISSIEPDMKKQKIDNLEFKMTEKDCQSLQSLEEYRGKLRYFTPEELLNLFGFNQTQQNIYLFFPKNEKLTLRKKYELIGNSLNVIVATKLIDFLFHSSGSDYLRVVSNGAGPDNNNNNSRSNSNNNNRNSTVSNISTVSRNVFSDGDDDEELLCLKNENHF